MDLPGLGLDLRRDRGQPRRQDSKARLAADLFALSRRSAAGRDLGPVAQRVQTRLLPGHRDRRDHPGRWPDLVPGTLLHPHINGKDAVAGSIRGSMLRRRSRGGSSRAPGSSSIGPTTALTTSTTSSTRSRRPRPMPPSTATSGSTHDHGFGLRLLPAHRAGDVARSRGDRHAPRQPARRSAVAGSRRPIAISTLA